MEWDPRLVALYRGLFSIVNGYLQVHIGYGAAQAVIATDTTSPPGATVARAAPRQPPPGVFPHDAPDRAGGSTVPPPLPNMRAVGTATACNASLLQCRSAHVPSMSPAPPPSYRPQADRLTHYALVGSRASAQMQVGASSGIGWAGGRSDSVVWCGEMEGALQQVCVHPTPIPCLCPPPSGYTATGTCFSLPWPSFLSSLPACPIVPLFCPFPQQAPVCSARGPVRRAQRRWRGMPLNSLQGAQVG
jgi:hypothetical protein